MASPLPATQSKKGLPSPAASLSGEKLQRVMTTLIETYKHHSDNGDLPVSESDCRAVIAALPEPVPASERAALKCAEQLIGNWPWLASTKQDLRVYTSSITTIFAAHSLEAAKHILHPVHGLVGQIDRPPAPAELNRALHAHDNRTRYAAHAAKWMIEEAARRREAEERERQGAIARAAFREKHNGKSLLEVAREALGK